MVYLGLWGGSVRDSQKSSLLCLLASPSDKLSRLASWLAVEALEAADVWRRDCGVLNSRLLEVQEVL